MNKSQFHHFFSFRLVIGLFVLIVLGATGYSFFLNPIKSKTGHKVLISFSLIDNLEKLLGNNSDENDLNCINGLKVFSMFLIILGHRIMFAVGSPVVNSDYVESVRRIMFLQSIFHL